MRTLKVVIPAALLMGGILFCTSAGYGKPEYAKKENMKCLQCHSKMEGKDLMAKNLNDTGKCYADNDHSIAKCKK